MSAPGSADASNLLVPGKVLLLLPRLVPLIGLNGAVVLQQVHYLTALPGVQPDREGRRWVRLGYAAWREEHFPFWKIDTVKRAFQGLEEEGLLDAQRTYATPRDQTKSYALNYARLADIDRVFRAAAGGTARGRVGRRRRSAAGDGGAPDERSLPATGLLLDDHPLVIIPRLATLIGLDEALVLQQVRYWLADDRHPRFHEGRRWVRFTQQEWARQIPRSLRTLGTVFRALEAQGLLVATTRLNVIPGDQTRWYTIDFERLRALDARAAPDPEHRGEAPARPSLTPKGNSAHLQSAKPQERDSTPASGAPDPTEAANSPPPIGKTAPFQTAIVRPPTGKSTPPQAADLPPSIRGGETKTKTDEKETQQQEGDERPTARSSPAPTVVVADDALESVGTGTTVDRRVTESANARALVETLIERGITGVVAVRLAGQVPGRIGRQAEVFDWLCEEHPTDERLTPGRLRKMIEEDWAPPPGFVPAAERTRGVAEAAATGESRRRQLEGERRMLQEREDTARLAAVGVTRDEQGSWRVVLDGLDRRRGGARFFADTLFREPRDGAPAVVIFRDPAAVAALDTPAGRAAFDELARRLAERYPRAAWPNPSLAPAIVLYDDLARALAGAARVGAQDASGTGHETDASGPEGRAREAGVEPSG